MIPFIDNLGLAGHHPFNFPAQLLNGADIDFLIPDNDKITDSAFEKQEPLSVLEEDVSGAKPAFAIKLNERLSVTAPNALDEQRIRTN